MTISWPPGNGLGDHTTADPGVFRGAFLSNETPSFSLAGSGATSWEIRNFYGTVVASGTRSGNTLTLSGPLPLGWYKLYLIRGTPAVAPWYDSGGERCFMVVRATSPLVTRPPANQAHTTTGGDIAADIPARGFFGIGPMRHKIPDLVTLGSAHTYVANEIGYQTTYAPVDSVRPIKPLTAFPNGFENTGGEITNLTTAVQAIVPAGGIWFEGQNEPSVTTAYNVYAPKQNNFANVVHAAHASAKVMGPCTLGITGDPNSSGQQLYYVNQILPLVGANLDGISFHNYDSPQGDLPAMRKILDGFVAVLTTHGQQNKPRWNTEMGSTFCASAGEFAPHWQVKNTMMDLHVYEQYGIPKEQCYLFYDMSHGFWGYPSFWMMRENSMGQATPLVTLMRVWAEELFGTTFNTRLNFGSEDNFFIGSKFLAPGGTSVVVVQSAGANANVRFTVTGASSVSVVDSWGNITSVAVSGGTITLPIDYIPTYIRCPVGVTVVPVALDYGVELIKAQRSTVTASSNPSTAPNAANLILDGSVGNWVATDANFPITWTATFPVATRFNRFAIVGPNPHNVTCCLQDFDVQAFVSGSWVTIATYTEPIVQKMWTSTNDAGGCFVDSFTWHRNTWLGRLSTPISATAVRLNIRSCSYGGGMTPESANQTIITVTGSPTGGTFTLTCNGQTTAAIGFNATPATVLTRLQAMTNGANFVAVYGNTLAQGITIVQKDFSTITATPSFTGGTAPTVTIDLGAIGQAGPQRPELIEVQFNLNEYDLGKVAGAPYFPAIV